MAVANYHDQHESLPPAYVVGPDGRPWHSWRVLILPFLEQREIYSAYNFDQPWDGPDNARLAPRIPNTYVAPDGRDNPTHSTSYVVAVGPETAFPGSRSLDVRAIPDGARDTILAFQVANSSIPWMAPRDLQFDRMSFRVNDGSGRGPGSHIGGARIAFLDGSVREAADDFDPATLRAMFTADGGEAIDWSKGRGQVIHGPHQERESRRR